MRPRWRVGLATTLSLVLHGAPLLIVFLLHRLPLMVTPPIPIEVLPARARVPARPPSPSEAKPQEVKPEPPRPAGAGTGRPKAKRRPGAGTAAGEKPGPPSPPPATADLRPIGPADARVVLVLRNDRLRASPHRQAVERVLESLPDYRTLLWGTGLTPIGDFDALLIASSNPRDVTATFLAARHADDPKLREALLRRSMPSWDPRVFRFVDPRFSVLVRPDAAARIDRAVAAEEARQFGPAMESAPVVVDAGAPAVDPADDPLVTWYAELRRFDQLADAPGAPAMMLSVSDVGQLVRVGAGLPTPASLALAATADAAPAVRLTLGFATEAEAQQFADSWPEILRRWRSSVGFLGLGAMLDGLEVKREGVTVEVAGRIPELQMKLAFSWVQAALPKPPSPEEMKQEDIPLQANEAEPAGKALSPSRMAPAPQPVSPTAATGGTGALDGGAGAGAAAGATGGDGG